MSNDEPQPRPTTHTGDPLTVRPIRAAFGPSVSLVSRDAEGRLWVRFSAALGVTISGMILVAVPLLALWWVGGGLVDSGRVDFDQPGQHTTIAPQDQPTKGPGSRDELPLAR